MTDYYYTVPKETHDVVCRERDALRAELDALKERRCEICGYAEHNREHTGCLRTENAALRADFDALNEVLRQTCEELDALKTSVPARLTTDGLYGQQHHYASGWNDCIDMVTAPKTGELNGPT